MGANALPEKGAGPPQHKRKPWSQNWNDQRDDSESENGP